MGSPAVDLAARIKASVEKKVGGKAVVGGKDKGGIDCFALVDQVLKEADAKTAADFGNVRPDGDYVWGEPVDLDAVQPGYILQFRDHTVTIRTETLGKFQWEETSVDGPARRPHHTAIVVEVRRDGSVSVVEQNVKPNASRITRNVIARLAPGEETRNINRTVRIVIRVTGVVKAYRPVPKQRGTMLLPLNDSFSVGRQRMSACSVPRDGGPKRRPGPLGIC
jgi:hypothetical protein